MVAPATTPSSLDVAVAIRDGGGEARGRLCDVLESTTSCAFTTHSSPCDVSDDEQHDHLADSRSRPLYSSSTKVMDDVSDYYRSAETPRSVVTGRASFRSIHIQIESMHHHSSSDAPPQSFSGGHGGRRRPLCTSTSTTSKRPRRFQATCRAVLVPLLVIVGPPALVLLLLHFSLSHVTLFVLNIATALAAWEWSWWSFRIRRRLLLPFQHAPLHADTTTTMTPPDHHANANVNPNAHAHAHANANAYANTNANANAYANANANANTNANANANVNANLSIIELQDAVLNEPALAIAKITKGLSSSRTTKYLVAAGIALLVTGIIMPVLVVYGDSIVTKHSSIVGKNVLLGSAASALFSAVFCACLAPISADAFIVCVYVTCFLVASLNSFFSHHEHLVHDPELLDSMYVLLVGACAIVVWRIISSKEVMESTIMAMLDFLGLAYLVAPMMAMADFLGHPKVLLYDDIVGTFFVVVSAAEAAYRLNEVVKTRYPRFLRHCRRPVAKHISNTLGFESLVLSVLFGAIAAILSVLCFKGYILYWQDMLIYLGVILMSQFCRIALDSMKALAKVDAVTYQPWLSGCMDLVNPYLLAMVVFHPYVKGLIKG